MNLPLSTRIVAAFAFLLLGFTALVAFIGHRVTVEHEHETLQRLSHGLARHIVEHWPEMAHANEAAAVRATQDEVLRMLMTVNPAIDVYVLDESGKVRTYLGDARAVLDTRVDLAAIRGFLAGSPLPLFGSDPKAPGAPKVFSAARFPGVSGATARAGYLYVVLAGEARIRAEHGSSSLPLWRSTAAVAGLGLLVTLGVGVVTFRRITRPLRQLAARMAGFHLTGTAASVQTGSLAASDNEVAAIERAFEAMAARIEQQVREQADQQAAHRDVVANVAHDLRTPLTALHGYLEALNRRAIAITADEHDRYLSAALSQSLKVQRLSQQLFELARLQSTPEVTRRDSFRLDELVHDTVQKFALSASPPPVTLAGPPPGRLDLEGDLQLIDRALTNLVDNAIRHGRGATPVRVSLHRDAHNALVLIEDGGPGLPVELSRRLEAGRPVREPPIEHPGGGFGGLGLAIAQRVAWLHGGNLRSMPSVGGGTRLCLALPLAAKPLP